MMGERKYDKAVLLIALLYVLFSGCRKEDVYFSGDAQLAISADTLYFDTVFTTTGSATRIIKLYNLENEPVLVDINLQQGDDSFFRINADGYSGNVLKDVEIGAKDSIYIFAEVTINPDMSVSESPFVIEENLIITQGGKESNIVFTAWGQNANYISMAGTFGLLTCDNQSLILDDPKPYVIYGILVIDDCSLVFPKGAKIHIHGGIAATPENQYYNDGQIIVLENGKLIVDGTYEEPVIIQGDRLEPAYEEVEGQWGGIRIFESSKGSFINNAVIKNSLVGVFVDSAAELTIKNTVVKNTSGSGIIGYHSKIQGDNLLIYNNGGSCFQGSYGGNYSFTYSTFGSYVNQNEAIAVNNKKCLDLSSDFSCSVLVAVNPLNISLTNCIIAGASSDEILLDDFTGDKIKSDFTYTLKNSIVKVADLLKSDQYPNFFENCEGCYNLKQNDKLFLNQPLDNYKLDTMSVALDKALYLPAFPKDIIGKDRNNQSPDIGCFEF